MNEQFVTLKFHVSCIIIIDQRKKNHQTIPFIVKASDDLDSKFPWTENPFISELLRILNDLWKRFMYLSVIYSM